SPSGDQYRFVREIPRHLVEERYAVRKRHPDEQNIALHRVLDLLRSEQMRTDTERQIVHVPVTRISVKRHAADLMSEDIIVMSGDITGFVAIIRVVGKPNGRANPASPNPIDLIRSDRKDAV